MRNQWMEDWIRYTSGTGVTLTRNALGLSIAVATSGVTAGTYTAATVTVDALGRVSAASSNTILTGSYTPKLTNVANSSARNAAVCNYTQAGTNVIVHGKCAITDASLAVETRVGISLPVASNFAAVTDCSGVAVVQNLGNDAGFIEGDTTNDRAEIRYVAADTGVSHDHYFTFQYRVI